MLSFAYLTNITANDLQFNNQKESKQDKEPSWWQFWREHKKPDVLEE
jgi:hypothetical protein